MAATKRARKRGRTGEKIVRATWIAKAVEFAVQGYSTRRIGRMLGKHHATIARALNEEFERTRPAAEDIERLRAVQNEQLDEQIVMWTAMALQPMPKLDVDGDGDPLDAARIIAAGEALSKRKVEAARIVLSLHKRKADLNGLDAPTKNELTGKDGGALDFAASLTDEQLEHVLRTLDPGGTDAGGSARRSPRRKGSESGEAE